METKQSRTLWDCLQILTKQRNYVLVTTSKCVYLQENLGILILILTYYFLLLLIIKVHYSQFLYTFYILFQNLSICFIDILHGKEFNSKVISNTHFLVPQNITQYIKMLFHILNYMLFFIRLKLNICFCLFVYNALYPMNFLSSY